MMMAEDRKPVNRSVDTELRHSESAFIGVFFHSHSYALSKALSQLLGSAQAVFMREYAKNLKELLTRGGGEYSILLNNIGSFCDVLESKKLAEKIEIEELGENRVKLIVKGCVFARLVHPILNIVDSKEFLCPIATMWMVAFANEKSLKVDWVDRTNLFDYIKFSESLSHLTHDGSETKFILVKK